MWLPTSFSAGVAGDELVHEYSQLLIIDKPVGACLFFVKERLEEDIIERVVMPQIPPKVKYSMTA